jgi:hypothetical protein
MARYEWDAFISFSHLDDLSPSTAPGWVTQFRNTLAVLLTLRLGRKASIWFDDKLNGQVLFDLRIQREIERSAALIVIYSASYMGSDYCTKEREWFARTGLAIGDQNRVLPVRLLDIPHERWPKEFEGCLGFEFFRAAPNDSLGFPLDPSEQGFTNALKNVVVAVQAICNALEVPQAEPPPQRTPAPPLVPAALPPVNGISAETLEFELRKRDFKADFQKCVTQIKLLSARKDLHDQLHELQFKFFVPVSDILSGNSLAIDGQLLDIVREHNFTLSEILDSLRAVVARNVVPPNELRWVDDIAKDQATLEASMRDLDLIPLRAAVKDIGRVIAMWPARINAKLNENARGLSLVDLATKLQELCTMSSTFGQQLGDKVGKLQDLHARISKLVADHDDWQTYDDDLSLLEGAVRQSLQEIAATWPGLKQKGNTLYGGNSAAWAQRLIFLGGEMDRALQTADMATAQKSFIRLRSAARDQFYRADQNLKDGCQALEQVGEPIDTVLGAV